jgi:hypothetical protein
LEEEEQMTCWGDACWNDCSGYQVYTEACKRADIAFIIIGSLIIIALIIILAKTAKNKGDEK